MKILFGLCNTASRNREEFLNAASFSHNGLSIDCIYGGDFVPGCFESTRLANQIVATRDLDRDEVLLVVIHPRINAARDVAEMANNDPLLVLALCSAEPRLFIQELDSPISERVLVLPEALPENADSDFSSFHGSVVDLISMLRQIEIQTVGSVEMRRKECANVSTRYAAFRDESRRRDKFQKAVKAALDAPDEQAAKRMVTRHYRDVLEFLKIAREYDREGGLTWVGRVSSFHHSELSPRFRSPENIFSNREDAISSWLEHCARLRLLLEAAFPFSLTNYARAATGKDFVAAPPKDVVEVLDLLNDLTTAMLCEEGDAYLILKNGMQDLSSRLSTLREDWYSVI